MKYLLILFLGLPALLVAQDKPVFNSKGQVVRLADDEGLKAPDMSEMRKPIDSVYRQWMAGKLTRTINNLEDDKSNAYRLYTTIWSKEDLVAYISELRKYRSGLRRGDSAVNGRFLPDFGNLLSRINSLFSVQKKEAEIVLYKHDILKEWLIDYHNSTSKESGLDEMEMDIKYFNAWRQAEDINRELKKIALGIAANEGFYVDCDNILTRKIDSLKGMLTRDKNNILQFFSDDYFKYWLWYTEGMPQVSPLNLTSADRLYPGEEEISGLNREQRDSLLRKLDSLNRWLETREAHNRIEMLPEGKRKLLALDYDASRGYRPMPHSTLPKMIERKDSLRLVVYNVPSDVILQMTLDTVRLEDHSSAILALNNVIGDIASLAGSLAAVGTPWAVISPMLNGVKGKVPTADDIKMPDQVSMKTSSADKSFGGGAEAKVVINGVVLELTMESETDKKKIIETSLMNFNPDKCIDCSKSVNDRIVDTFLSLDSCYALNYSKPKLLEESVRALLERFKCFLKCIQTLDIQKANELRNAGMMAEMLVSMKNRSLPPARLQALESSSPPKYNTVLLGADLPSPSQKITYSILAKIPDTCNKSTEPCERTYTTKVLGKHSFKLAKTHYVNFSAGIAYTFSDFNVSEKQENGLPTISTGDRFRPVAGLHVYPLGLVKINNKLFPKDFYRRFSIYGGLGIIKPLQNIYTGVGYDVVPGISIVGGHHLYWHTKYTVVGGQVTDEASSFRSAGWFVSLNLEPKTFAGILGIIK